MRVRVRGHEQTDAQRETDTFTHAQTHIHARTYQWLSGHTTARPTRTEKRSCVCWLSFCFVILQQTRTHAHRDTDIDTERQKQTHALMLVVHLCWLCWLCAFTQSTTENHKRQTRAQSSHETSDHSNKCTQTQALCMVSVQQSTTEATNAYSIKIFQTKFLKERGERPNSTAASQVFDFIAKSSNTQRHGQPIAQNAND